MKLASNNLIAFWLAVTCATVVEGTKFSPMKLGSLSLATVAAAGTQNAHVRGGGPKSALDIVQAKKEGVSAENSSSWFAGEVSRHLNKVKTATCNVNDPTIHLSHYPTLDGIISEGEYAEEKGWKKLPMYDAGKNGESARNIRGEAYVGYFCPLSQFCTMVISTNGETIDEKSEENWVQFIPGGSNGLTPKNFLYKDGSDYAATSWSFIKCPDSKGGMTTCGWEACWDESERTSKLFSENLFIEVHYNSEAGDTRSTGKDRADPSEGVLCSINFNCGDNKCSADNDCDFFDTECIDYECDSFNGICEKTFVSGSCDADGFPGCCSAGVCVGGSTICTSGTGECGNGVVDEGEECDSGLELGDEKCSATCTDLPYCGDGIKNGNEECDAGAANSQSPGALCRSDCTLPTCGDGIQDPSEECDSGAANSDTTPNACRKNCETATCGDGTLDDGEQCDAGAANSQNADAECRTNCKLPTCGDGIKDSNEECDSGAANSDTTADACRKNCEAPKCGDGIVDDGEQCDDGNTHSGDGCDSTCQNEVGVCGDGHVDDGEQCDDGNTVSGDGCNKNCVIEACYQKNEGDLCKSNPDLSFDGCCSAGMGDMPGSCNTAIPPADTDSDNVPDTCCPCPMGQDPPSFFIGTSSTPLSSSILTSVECGSGQEAPIPNLVAKDCAGKIVPFSRLVDTVVEDPSTPAGVCAVKTITRKWQAMSCGQTSVFEQIITIQDTTAPDVSGVQDKSFACLKNIPSVVGDIETASDTCSGDVMSSFAADVSTAQFCGTFRKYKFIDECGNEATKMIAMKVTDQVAPTLTIKDSHMVKCIDDVKTLPTWATVTDNCDTETSVDEYESEVTVPPTGACLDQTIKRTFTATDECGNVGSTEQVIVVKDNEAPALPSILPANKDVQCASDVGSVPSVDNAVDNCYGAIAPVFSTSTSSTSPTCPNSFVTERTWTFTDACGLADAYTQTITVADTTSPTFPSFPADKSYTCKDPCVSDKFLHPMCTGTPTTKDNCDAAPTPTTFDTVTAPDGKSFVVVTRTWAATDSCDNTVTKDQAITVYDSCDFTISDAFSGKDVSVSMAVNAVEDSAVDAVDITVTVDDELRTGDIRGVFFTVLGDAGLLITDITGSDVTSFVTQEGAVDRVANDAIMEGGGKDEHVFDVGVEIGTQGMSIDDFQTTTFRVFGVSTANFLESKFAVRLTSVTDDRGGREDSSKITGPSECCRYVPTP